MHKVVRIAATALSCGASQTQSRAQTPEKIIIESDIGDDIDDAFALGLAAMLDPCLGPPTAMPITVDEAGNCVKKVAGR